MKFVNLHEEQNVYWAGKIDLKTEVNLGSIDQVCANIHVKRIIVAHITQSSKNW